MAGRNVGHCADEQLVFETTAVSRFTTVLHVSFWDIKIMTIKNGKDRKVVPSITADIMNLVPIKTHSRTIPNQTQGNSLDLKRVERQ